MAEYHVGCGITAIYAGTLNKKGDQWLHKSPVTDETFSAVAQYCLENDEAMEFDYEGKRYRLSVKEVEAEGSEENKVDVLDKIRAEIKAMSGDIETIADVLVIIDKCRAESEEV